MNVVHCWGVCWTDLTRHRPPPQHRHPPTHPPEDVALLVQPRVRPAGGRARDEHGQGLEDEEARGGGRPHDVAPQAVHLGDGCGWLDGWMGHAGPENARHTDRRANKQMDGQARAGQGRQFAGPEKAGHTDRQTRKQKAVCLPGGGGGGTRGRWGPRGRRRRSGTGPGHPVLHGGGDGLVSMWVGGW